MNEELKQLCQIVARLADVVEGVTKDARTSEIDINRIHNVRHDVLMLARKLLER